MASDAQPENEFGSRIAANGDVVLVGVPNDFGLGDGTGAAYAFRWNGSAWIEEAQLTPSQGDFADGFGFSVAISGDTAVVGAMWDDDSGFNAGAAYVFQHDGSAWQFQQKLIASDGVPHDWFGVSVAIAPDLILVGASRGAGLDPDSGCAYVFRWDGTQWVEEQKLIADDAGGPGDNEIGWSVGLSLNSGGTAVLSHHRDNDFGALNGSAYIFTWNGVEWLQTQELFAPDAPPSGDLQFGRSLSIDGDRLVIGAHHAAITGLNDGAAYVFHYDNDRAQWVFQEQLLPEPIPSTSLFGYSVAISGDTVVCGAYGEFNQSGSAYVFDVDPIPADLDCDGVVGPADLAALLAQWGECAKADCPADISPPPTSGGGDGMVNPADLAELLANWG